MACGIWAACQTGADDYISFTISRLFGGMLGSVPSILGSGMIVDIFYLHERGRAFTTFSLCFLLGTVAGPTFGGFIVEHVPWPNEFWWTVGLQAAVALLGMLFKLLKVDKDKIDDTASFGFHGRNRVHA